MKTMNRIETIEEFYKRKFDWMPDNIRKGIGHFNVFALEPLVKDDPRSVSYARIIECDAVYRLSF